MVGVNRFESGEEERPPLLKVDEALMRTRSERLQALRAARDNDAVDRSMAAIAEAAGGTANLMPRILTAIEARATLGEISDCLRETFGTYTETFSI